jgi:hypothetical protein
MPREKTNEEKTKHRQHHHHQKKHHHSKDGQKEKAIRLRKADIKEFQSMKPEQLEQKYANFRKMKYRLLDCVVALKKEASETPTTDAGPKPKKVVYLPNEHTFAYDQIRCLCCKCKNVLSLEDTTVSECEHLFHPLCLSESESCPSCGKGFVLGDPRQKEFRLESIDRQTKPNE